jgi:uncharacterized membrane protein YphA (DoxX/SURF4 family)
MKRIKRVLGASCGVFRNRYLSLVFRIAVGVVFIISGSGKLPEGAAFVNQVEGFDLLPNVLARFYGTALPWVEIVIGALLILGLLSRFAAGIGGLAALSFIIANSISLYRGLNLECGCFGNVAVLHTRDALIIDFMLLIMALQILIHKGEFLSVDSRIFRKKAPGTG